MKTTYHTQQGITTRYDLQEDQSTVRRTAISYFYEGEHRPQEHALSSWKWGKDGWTGDLSGSNAGYEVAKAFGFIDG